MKTKWKYCGAGFVPGVPARDLTLDEANQFGVEFLQLTGMYVLENEGVDVPPIETEKPVNKRKGN